MASTVSISTAGGRQMDVAIEAGETTATLKKKILELMKEAGKSGTQQDVCNVLFRYQDCLDHLFLEEKAEGSGFKLLKGLEPLNDDWLLEEHIDSTTTLTLVMSPGPSGCGWMVLGCPLGDGMASPNGQADQVKVSPYESDCSAVKSLAKASDRVYFFTSDRLGAEGKPPAGRNTSAKVCAEFDSGTAKISRLAAPA
eukprot:Skav217698  [mRNA]  locus=scaffold1925:184767:186814:- [translate_table: standard]